MAKTVLRTPESLLRQQLRLRDDQRITALREIPVLEALPLSELRLLGRHAVLRVFADQATILTERMPNDYLYIVLHGTVMVNLHDRIGRDVSLGRLPVGTMFGEGPLFGNRFGGVSVVAQSSCQLLQISLDLLRREQAQLGQLMAQLRAMYRQRLVQSTLARVPFLAQLSDQERSNLIEQLIVRDVQRGEYIVRAGNRPNGLHLIELGQCAVSRDDQVMGHLEEGDFFGALALMSETPATDDVRAVTPCTIMTLPSLSFFELLRQRPELTTAITQLLTERRDYIERQKEELGGILQKGSRRGDTVFVRDVNRCPPDCRLCVQACTTRHGAARMHHTGMLYEQVLLVDACRQCRHGAECVEACPSNAITWQGTALVVQENCTGCGECVPACPYQAMTLEPRDRSWRGQLHRGLAQIPLIPLTPQAPLYQAAKCDFCAGHDDMACVSVCPIGALRLVAVETLFPY